VGSIPTYPTTLPRQQVENQSKKTLDSNHHTGYITRVRGRQHPYHLNTIGVASTLKEALNQQKDNKLTTTLNSSFLREASYNAGSRTLTVVFSNDKIYTYENVDQSVYQGLITAESSSRFFTSNIRDSFTTTG
jgi:hypothetical protein|tara:strand:+ start:381 stop:779 length:399 start_codon:yes stop_codon:yes gene_type:complete